MINNKWMTINDVMEFFGTSKYTIYRWMKKGNFPVGKLTPAGRLWSVTSLENWLSNEDAPKNNGANAAQQKSLREEPENAQPGGTE